MGSHFGANRPGVSAKKISEMKRRRVLKDFVYTKKKGCVSIFINAATSENATASRSLCTG